MYFNKKSKRWERKWFPYPDVFYNRRVSKLMKNTKVERIRNTFDRLGIPKINSQHYFDKWDVYLKLKQYKELRPHLPETVFYRNRNDLSRMVRESRRLFLKSLTQNNGLGIFIVTKRRKGFQYSYYKRKKLSRGYVSTFNSLLKKIRQFFKNKPFIIQKSINLIRVNNKVADLRCDVQRNGQDEIECVAHSVRIGVKNSPITNTRTKPTIYPFDRFLIHKMGYTRKQVKR
ncbi:YheC/YheD family protein [Thalassobacillus sp. C254]|uniref:YheC/YheD family protein n=1 Tax=Thalassobacillus sp. C254 TaxID=1225341 RepID=UPI0009F86F21|nr:YheC/YheD family protein [Thalassobacillus sp. C254]